MMTRRCTGISPFVVVPDAHFSRLRGFGQGVCGLASGVAACRCYKEHQALRKQGILGSDTLLVKLFAGQSPLLNNQLTSCNFQAFGIVL
jgi:hypothetical protein